MNWLRKYVTRSTDVSLSILFVLTFSVFGFGQKSNNHAVHNFKNEQISFKKDHSFSNKDTEISEITEGEWKSISSGIILKGTISDTIQVADTLTTTYKSDARISLTNGTKFITLRRGEREQGNLLSSIGRGALGILALIFVGYLFSADRKNISWSLVIKGILLQLVLALLILKAPFVEQIFEFISRGFVKVIDMAHEGATFVFGDFSGGGINPYVRNFATWILPSVIFFSALSSLLYYWGILQRVVMGMAWVMKRILGLSGAESVSAAGNIFLGQTEAPFLVKPYLGKMTKSEILCLMAGGMATIAGGVLASYIGFLGGEDPQAKVYFAKHLLTASLMSAPAAIVFAKMLFPEKEKFNEDLSVSKDKLGTNALEAISNGTTDGLKLAVNVAAMLIVFISLVALANYMLGKIGYYTGVSETIAAWGHYPGLSFQAILGYSLSPFAWLMGVPWNDCLLVGQLLGEKTIINEFVAYTSLGDLQHYMSDKATLMSTYVLCGFANIASIGIQIGGIGALAPDKKSTLAQFGVKALIAGTLACMSTAVIAGMLY
jgi:CNT family concentrative nucleoside transporter